MDGIEEVLYKKKPVALVFRHTIPIDGINFLTTENNPFQVGLQKRPKGKHLPPHYHPLPVPITVTEVQEIIYVVSGKIQVTLCTKEGKEIEKKILIGGDSILLMREGHGVDFLEDSQLFEVKQGPYPGVANAKIFVKDTYDSR